MNIFKHLTFLTAATGLLLTSATAAFAGRSAEELAFGAENHQQVLAQFGGEIDDLDVVEYVDAIGRKLVQYSTQPDDEWTFTVLDTPQVNAFATPGGYLYVTRGLLALANDEAELASVIGHEIAHITAEHLTSRQEEGGEAIKTGLLGALLGAVFSNGENRLGDAIEGGIVAALGHMGEFSQAQEFEADRLGIQILNSAGYDPYAAADFLDSLSAKHELESLIAGVEYNPNSVAFFSTHPATGDRIREAIAEAETAGMQSTDNPRNEQTYLDMIDGIIYGDNPSQGFVRGRSFLHPDMRFAFEVPEGFNITNTTNSVRANNGAGSALVLSGDRKPNGSLANYITRVWAPQINRSYRLTASDVDVLEINGLEAATAILPVNTPQGPKLIQLTVILHNNSLYRISGTSIQGDEDTRVALLESAKSFRALSDRDVSNLNPYTIDVQKVGWRDTVEKLAAQLPFGSFQEERFRTLNGLNDNEELQRGDLVKLIVD